MGPRRKRIEPKKGEGVIDHFPFAEYTGRHENI
jgi:hypothetical protein